MPVRNRWPESLGVTTGAQALIGRVDAGRYRSLRWSNAPSGRFSLYARTDIPQQAMLDGTYRLSAVQRES